MQILLLLIVIILAYLAGSLSSAIIVCKLLGLEDPRQHGSKNPGATNVLRIGGKKAAAFTLIGDVLKGFLPVFIVSYLSLSPVMIAAALIASVLGHLYPLFFGFKGGKGVATLIGGLFALSWPSALCWLLLWLAIIYVTRFVSLASMIAAVSTPLFIYISTQNIIYVIATSILAIIIVVRHHSNIKNLTIGAEPRFSFKKDK